MQDTLRLDPITRYVRSLPEPYWLTREAALILHTTRRRLRRLAARGEGELGPGHVTWLGDVMIYLYDERDLNDLRAYFARCAASRGPGPDPFRGGRGRPPMWNEAEQEDRHRRQVLVRYHRLKADEHEHGGHLERAAKHRCRARVLSERLAVERDLRRAELF